MDANRKIIHSVTEKFPTFDDDVRWLFLVDHNFRELCTDYILCAEKIAQLKSTLDNYIASMQEYEQLKEALEGEIFAKLVIAKNKPLN